MRSIKTRATALALAASIFTASTVAPRRAEAGAGLLIIGFGGSALVGSGFFLASVGGAISTGYFFKKGWDNKGAKAVAAYLLAAVTALGAVYLLDDSQAQSGEFKSVTDAQAEVIGLTAAEKAAYDSELPLINSIREESVVRANAAFAGLDASKAGALEQVAAHMRSTWNELSAGTLSAEAISAVEKMAAAVSSN